VYRNYVLPYEPVTISACPGAITVKLMDPKSPRGARRDCLLASAGMLRDEATHLFVVEHRLPGITERGLTMLQAALHESSARFTARGEHITYLRSTFLPDQDRLLSLFSAMSLELVRAANEASLVPYLSIERATDLPDPSGATGG
jgi:hypothetical protein